MRPSWWKSRPAEPADDVEAPLLLLLPVVLAALVFWPSPQQWFFREDLYHVYRAVNQPWPALLLQHFAGHVYASLSLMAVGLYALFGLNADGWFAVLTALHLVDVALCFRLIRLATGSARLACVGSLLWAVTPTHAEAMTWWVMTGHVLATTCVFGVLASVLATAGRAPGIARSVAWVVALLVAGTANGAGAAAALVAPLAAFLLLPAGPGRRRSIAALAAAGPPIVVLMIVSRAAVDHVSGFVPGYTPGFPPPKDWPNVVRLLVELLRYAIAGPLLSFAVPVPTPTKTWLVGLAWLAATAAGLVFADRDRRRAILAFLLVALAVYGLTALGRGAFYDMLARVAGEGGAVPRYHYLGTGLLLIVGCLVADTLLRRWSLPLPRAGPPLVAATLLGASIVKPLPITYRQESRSYLAAVRVAIEAAATAAAPPGGRARLPNRPTPNLGGMTGQVGFPGWAAALALTDPDGTIAGRRVLLVEEDPHVRRLAAVGRRTGRVVVAPDAAAPQQVRAAPPPARTPRPRRRTAGGRAARRCRRARAAPRAGPLRAARPCGRRGCGRRARSSTAGAR
jgi:hypothetical protein